MVMPIGNTSSLDFGSSSMASAPVDDGRSKKFEQLLQRFSKPAPTKTAVSKEGSAGSVEKSKERKELEEAAKQMEIQMYTMMLKTMEKSASENGILGDGKSAGMNHFKDLFFYQVAEQAVSQQGLGFAQSLLTANGVK